MTRFFRAFIILQSVLWNTFVHDSMCRKLISCAIFETSKIIYYYTDAYEIDQS